MLIFQLVRDNVEQSMVAHGGESQPAKPILAATSSMQPFSVIKKQNSDINEKIFTKTTTN